MEESDNMPDDCTHDNIEQWISQTNKTIYERNKFTGMIDIVTNTVKETQNDASDNECQDCGKSLEYDEFIRGAPPGFKHPQKVYEVNILETEINRYTHLVFADSVEEAEAKALKGDSLLSGHRRLETTEREIDGTELQNAEKLIVRSD